MNRHNLTMYGLAASCALASMVMHAKAATPAAPPAPPAPPAPAFKSGYDFAELALPPSTRGGRIGGGGEPSKIALALAEVPLNRSFLESVTIPDTITDTAEREKAFKDAARKLTNKLSGAIRRYKKQDGNELHNFAMRTVNDDTYGHGVRVWRVKDDEPAPATPPAPPAPPAPPKA